MRKNLNEKRYTGIVKWWRKEDGFGFIEQVESLSGEPIEVDVAVHHSSVRRSHRKERVQLQKMEVLEFGIEISEKGPRATNVVRVLS